MEATKTESRWINYSGDTDTVAFGYTIAQLRSTLLHCCSTKLHGCKIKLATVAPAAKWKSNADQPVVRELTCVVSVKIETSSTAGKHPLWPDAFRGDFLASVPRTFGIRSTDMDNAILASPSRTRMCCRWERSYSIPNSCQTGRHKCTMPTQCLILTTHEAR